MSYMIANLRLPQWYLTSQYNADIRFPDILSPSKHICNGNLGASSLLLMATAYFGTIYVWTKIRLKIYIFVWHGTSDVQFMWVSSLNMVWVVNNNGDFAEGIPVLLGFCIR